MRNLSTVFHFAYPNVIPRDGTFLGCGRYVAAPLENSPGPEYSLVELHIPNITEVHLTALQLAPESAESNHVIYERRDPSPYQFRGESKDLAYVLALISRTRFCRIAAGGFRGDAWCTGRIDIKGENRPFLKTVDVTGFSIKLNAFLADDQPDYLFFVPAANVLPSHEVLFQQHSVQVLSLAQFQQQLRHLELGRKTIIKILGDELELLVACLFTPPGSQDGDIANNPYRGLFVFREQDAEVFFGRDTLVRQCTTSLLQRAFLALIGPSGCGKSSLVYAGIFPQLRRREDWHIMVCRLGTDPWYSLASDLLPVLHPEYSDREQIRECSHLTKHLHSGQHALQETLATVADKYPSRRFLVFVDQFEELYTLCCDAHERHNFLQALLTIPASPRWHLVLTMRADFLGKACSYRPFADVLQQVSVFLGPMNQEELRESIEKPAEKYGITFEQGLTDRILEAIGHEPGNLSLLEFALSQLWNQQDNYLLTHAAYQRIGGVQQALARYADTVYEHLHPDHQRHARRIFTQLIHPGEGTEDTRRVATQEEIGTEHWELVTKLADARLVVTGPTAGHAGVVRTAMESEESGDQDILQTVEMVHEALIHGWQRLQEWLDTDRDFRKWQERLRIAMHQWHDSHQDSGGLLRGILLAEAETWLQQSPEALSPQERAFIEASVRLRDREIHIHKSQQRHKVIGLTLGLVIAISLALLALYERNLSEEQWLRAEKQAQIAQQQRQLAFSRQLEAETQRKKAETQAEIAQQHLYEAEVNAMKALSQTSKALLLSYDHLGALLSGVKAGKHAARLLLPVSLRHQIRFTLYDVLDNSIEQNRLEGHTGAVKNVCFSPDGRLLASASNDGSIILWDALNGRKLLVLRGHFAAVKSVCFSPDGQWLASGGSDTMIRLWDVSTALNTGVAAGQRVDTLLGHLGPVHSLRFSPDGRLLASGSEDRTVKLWDMADRRRLTTFYGHAGPVRSVSFHPEGQILASGSDDGTIKFWDVAARQESSTLYAHTQTVWTLDFSPDGTLVASGSEDSTIKVWYFADSSEFLTLPGHADGVKSVKFSPDGRRIASGSDDVERVVSVWDVHTGKLLNTLHGHDNSIVSLDVNPAGDLLASASDDHQIRLWNIRDQQQRSTIYMYPDQVTSVAMHPDGALLAISGDREGTITIWDMAHNKRFRTLYGYAGQVRSLSFSPDGTLLASGNHDHTITLWEVRSGDQIGLFRGHTGTVRSVSFSPDGILLVSGSDDSTIKIWNVAESREVKTLEGHIAIVHQVAFSPDGILIASAGQDATIRLWNVNDGHQQLVLHGHIPVVRSLAFSPDGKLLASGSGDNTIKLWDLNGGRELRTLKGHSRMILTLAFSPDGSLLASGSQDDAIKLWSIPDGRELITLEEHTRAVNSVQFTPDDLHLVSGGDDGQVKLWEFDMHALVQRTCRHLEGYLAHNPQVTDVDRTLCQELTSGPEAY